MTPFPLYKTIHHLPFQAMFPTGVWEIIMIFMLLFWLSIRWLQILRYSKGKTYGSRKGLKQCGHFHYQPKPPWVKRKVIRLSALMPQAGCRTVAHTFNRLHEHQGMTVGKSFVHETIKKHQYDIQVMRRKLKHKRPKPVPHNLVWGIDLTGKTDTSGKLHNILAIVEHQSRAALCLTVLKDKASITLLECLIAAIKQYDKPKFIRTDNEAVFTSTLFRFGLWLLGIKQQTTDIAHPWQNGKVERFFGSLKQKLNQWETTSFEELSHSLQLFRFWYNHVRPHDYLDGWTPAEQWRDKKGTPYEAQWFEAWSGLLSGYYLPP